ncbi:MAG: hypothetical protein C9356_11520 [Oleiphilus sp.]|nr:MAG: hypothetical protein C9356_11520 [Oleiphilus sp.]
MQDASTPDITMDADALYQEDTFTDQKVGTIRRMTPVTVEGEIDPNRAVMYVGHAQMMTPAGALPLNFEIEADSLADAVAKFSEGAGAALEETMQELQELRRQQASQIMVPGESDSRIQMP